jgi:hypothetical protein
MKQCEKQSVAKAKPVNGVFGVSSEFEFHTCDRRLSASHSPLTVTSLISTLSKSFFSTDRQTQRRTLFFSFQRVSIPELCRSTTKLYHTFTDMNKRGMAHVRVGHAGAPQSLQKRSCESLNQCNIPFSLISCSVRNRWFLYHSFSGPNPFHH